MRISALRNRSLPQLFLLLLLAALTACSTTSSDIAHTVGPGEPGTSVLHKDKAASWHDDESWIPVPPPCPVFAAPPRSHVWQYLYSLNDEPSGYATYSYVLAGRDERNRNASAIYLRLVEAIQSSTSSTSPGLGAAERHVSNLFLIPSRKVGTGGNDAPDYEMSKTLLSMLARKTSMRFTRPGPYIITLYRQISLGRPDELADILYVDMTDVRPGAVAEFVRTYKEQVSSGNIAGIQQLKSLRLAILNTAIVTEENIGFAKSAYAELQETFRKAGASPGGTH